MRINNVVVLVYKCGQEKLNNQKSYTPKFKKFCSAL